MSDKQSIDEALAVQRASVANQVEYIKTLQADLQSQHAECKRIAADPETQGGHSNYQLERAEQRISSIELEIETANDALEKANRALQRLEHAQDRRAGINTLDKTKAVDDCIREQQIALAALDRRGEELVTAMANDPTDEALHEDIALNDEKRAATIERLNVFKRARDVAAGEDQANADAVRMLGAFASRDKAVSLAHKRVNVAERIDAHLAGLAPLLREWREIDDAVCTATSDALRSLCASADFPKRSRIMQIAGRASPTNSIARAVAQALLLANVQDVVRDQLEFRYATVMDAKRHPITAAEQAAKVIPNLAAELDEVLREVDVVRHD